jgi:hypothetical protein
MRQGQQGSSRAALPVDVVTAPPIDQIGRLWGSMGRLIVWGATVCLGMDQLRSVQGVAFQDARANQLESVKGRHGTRWQVSPPVP